ncbi:adenylate kinase [Streptomyces sp. NK08204]|uniref:adenylate kinase n=1 Tax=Streptomyces sp. NK08204 TaxID=2873260 RepID=UPI001CEC63C2|nr:adenylate kinase [Streptomyces sp. NK08204]
MRIVLIGPPGAGKGTQARILADLLSVPAISSGDLFRAEIGRGTEIGDLVRRHTEAGELVPDELTTAVVTRRLGEPDAADGFLLDGFPRTVRQAELLSEALAESGTALDAVIALDMPDEEIVQRLTGRRMCPACGTTVHAVFSPPRVADRCDGCAGPLLRRADDTEETVVRRLTVYGEQTVPLLRWYANRGLLSHVDATGTVPEVFGRMRSALAAVTV